MLMIRLQRVGRSNDPSFRLVLTDKRNSTKSGRFLEVLGHFDFRKGRESGNHFDAPKIKQYISKGAQVSITAHNILIDSKIITGKKRDALPPRNPVKEEPGAKKEVAGEVSSTPVSTPETAVEGSKSESVPAAASA